MDDFGKEVRLRIASYESNNQLRASASAFMIASARSKYSYNFSWAGRPIIQYPQDIVAMQEIIWAVKPDLIIETGIAHGGSLIFSAAMLSQLDLCEAVTARTTFDPLSSRRKVVGVDVDIRPHNRQAIESHPLYSRIQMIEGSSISNEVIEKVHLIASNYERVLICLDSNHTYDHVKAELAAYAGLTSLGSYCCVFDTLIEDMPEDMYPDRSWGPGNNPKLAVIEFLKDHAEFEIDSNIHNKLQITVAPSGYLKRIS